MKLLQMKEHHPMTILLSLQKKQTLNRNKGERGIYLPLFFVLKNQPQDLNYNPN
jgi:hypothetical protein